MRPFWGEQAPPPGLGEAGDRGFTGMKGEIYILTNPLLYTVPVEDLKNIPCFFTLPEIWNLPSLREVRTLYDFFFANGLSGPLPRVYAIPDRTFLMYPEGIECWYATAYFVTWSSRGCEILGCALFPKSAPEEQGMSYFGSYGTDMFFVLSPCQPLRSCETRIAFEKNIIIFRPSRAEAHNPFKAFQPK